MNCSMGLDPEYDDWLVHSFNSYFFKFPSFTFLVKAKGAKDVRREDWSYIIAPFWKAVIKSSLNPRSIFGVLKSGFSTLRGAYAMLLMLRGFDKGIIKFGLITCTKPVEN